MQFTQRQARLDVETNQMVQAGMIELTRNLIQNYPENVNNKSGWMDAEFLEVGGDAKYFNALVPMYLALK